MPVNPTVSDAGPDSRLTYGLYQGEVIGSRAAQTYRRALNQRFLPRLLLRLEEQISGNMNNPDLMKKNPTYVPTTIFKPSSTLYRIWQLVRWFAQPEGRS